MTPDDYAMLPAHAADHRLAYGDHPDQFGDLYLPRSRPDPPSPTAVLILLHGGCWRSRFGLAPLGQLARRITERGAAVWNLEYRRLGGGGGWPATFLDVAAGADFLRSLARPHDLDLSRVVAAGHSAGGHLACWLASRHVLPPGAELHRRQPLGVTAVVSLAGIPDLALAAHEGICAGAPVELMGGTAAEVPQRYAQGSPLAAAPVTVPQWHVVGEADALVPAAYVRRCVGAARAREERAELVALAGAGHFEIVVTGSRVWSDVEAVIVNALG